MVSLVAAWVVASSGGSDAVPARIEVEGTLGYAYACGSASSEHPHAGGCRGSLEFSLTTPEGRSYRLDAEKSRLDGASPKHIEGLRVRVQGSLRDGRLAVESVVSLSRQRVRREGDVQTVRALSTTPQKYLTVLARFSDFATVTPYPRSQVIDLFRNSYPGLSHYFREQSYEEISLVGSEVTPWVNLPNPRAYYSLTSWPGWDLDKLLEDAVVKAKEAGYDLTQFVGLNVITNVNFLSGAGGMGGGKWADWDGTNRIWKITGNNGGNWGGLHNLLAHEMGHSLGMDHSAGPYSTSYDSKWDQMSGGYFNPSGNPYGWLGVHTNAFHREEVGWLPPTRRVTVLPGGDVTVRLERLAQPTNAVDPLVVRVYKGTSGGYYTVEARKRVSYDSGIPGNAVILHDIERGRQVVDEFTGAPYIDRNSRVVDVDNNGNPNDAAAMWVTGETFTDSANGITVSVLSEDATGFTVRVTSASTQPMPSLVRNSSSRGGGSLKNARDFARDYEGTTIGFNIPRTDPGFADGFWTIKPQVAPEPIARRGVTVDGTTQTTNVGNTSGWGPEVVVDGSASGPWWPVFEVTAPDVTLRGVGVVRSPRHGIAVWGTQALRTRVEGCFLGLLPNGTKAGNAYEGVVFFGGAKSGTVGGATAAQRNVISGNGFSGVGFFDAGTSGHRVEGNWIGLSHDGRTALGNGGDGVNASDLTSGITVVRNVIAGNTYASVRFRNVNTGAARGNLIGFASNGTTPLTALEGIVSHNGSQKITVGGALSADRNVIANCTYSGIGIWNTLGATIQNNWIGFDRTGANSDTAGNGIQISEKATGVIVRNNTVGNAANGIGLWDIEGAVLQNNATGLTPSGAAAPNQYNGVAIGTGCKNVLVGGPSVSHRNFSGGNGYDGFATWESTGTTFQNNWSGMNRAGESVPNQSNGFWLGGTGHRVLSNRIGGTVNYNGIALNGATNATVTGNIIGFLPSGAATVNGTGIGVWSSTNITLGGTTPALANVIGNAKGNGIAMFSTLGSRILGNRVGFSSTGVPAPILREGINVGDGVENTTVAGNVVGHSVYNGIVTWKSKGVTIENNRVGAWTDGAAAFVDGSGVSLAQESQGAIARSNFIRNVRWSGIQAYDCLNPSLLDNDVQLAQDRGANLTRVDGGTVRGNSLIGGVWGLVIWGTPGKVTVENNVIAGASRAGLALWGATTGNRIIGNFVGLLRDGTSRPNGEDGIVVGDGSTGNVIGEAGAGNQIANNAWSGVMVWGETTLGNTIRFNDLRNNGRLGIDLNWNNGAGGVSMNDERDPDGGPNRTQNFPSFTTSSRGSTTITLNMGLSSTPNRTFLVDLYLSSARDPSNYGEGSGYLTTVEVTTNAFGEVSFAVTIPIVTGAVTATATDKLTGDTSEFSLARNL